MKTKLKKAKDNTFVQMDGFKKGKEVFNSIFCPKAADVVKAIRTHLIDFYEESSPEENDFVDFSKQVVEHGGATISMDGTEDFVKISFHGF